VGQQALASLDASGHTVTIVPAEEIPNADIWDTKPVWKTKVPSAGWANENGTPGVGANVKIGAVPSGRFDYDPNAVDWRATPPIFSLFHEIAHAEDGVYGRVLPDSATSRESGQDIPDNELSATGLPYQQYGDEVPDPNLRPVTENALRGALGWELRPSYGDPAKAATEGLSQAPNPNRPTGPIRAI
jgi:hypothetical protein